MAEASARVGRIAPWNDGAGDEWRAELPAVLGRATRIGIEPDHMPPLVRAFVDQSVDATSIASVTPHLAQMRMIKDGRRTATGTACGAGRRGHDAGRARGHCRRCAGIRGGDCHVAGGHAQGGGAFVEAITTMRTCRPTRISCRSWPPAPKSPKPITAPRPAMMRKGEPVFLCFCGMTNFHRFKLGLRPHLLDRRRTCRRKPGCGLRGCTWPLRRRHLRCFRPGVTAESCARGLCRGHPGGRV